MGVWIMAGVTFREAARKHSRFSARMPFLAKVIQRFCLYSMDFPGGPTWPIERFERVR
jgi:hypothetical protein